MMKILIYLYLNITVYAALVLKKILYYITNKTSTFNSNKILSYFSLIFIRSFLIENIKVYYVGEVLDSKNDLLISNHVNHFDSFIIWCALTAIKKPYIIVFAKKTIYFFAKFMELVNENCIKIFLLKRDINYDLITLVDSSKKINKIKEKTVVLFPEGTLYSRKTSKKINENRAKTRNIKPYKNVVVPKSTGFNFLTKRLELDSIINCTLIYSEQPSLKKILCGQKINVDVYLEKLEVPRENTDIWLLNVFRIKDDFIKLHPIFLPNTYTINIQPSINFFKNAMASN